MLTTCPITGVYIPRFLLSVVTGFIFLMALGFGLHHKLLHDIYAQTPQLWRAPEEMAYYFRFVMLGNLALAVTSALLFTRHYEGKGLGEGLRFGAYFGLVLAGLMAAPYGWMPISGTLALAWAAGGFIQGLGLGIIFALTYRKN